MEIESEENVGSLSNWEIGRGNRSSTFSKSIVHASEDVVHGTPHPLEAAHSWFLRLKHLKTCFEEDRYHISHEPLSRERMENIGSVKYEIVTKMYRRCDVRGRDVEGDILLMRRCSGGIETVRVERWKSYLKLEKSVKILVSVERLFM